jgi:hypothetical protein
MVTNIRMNIFWDVASCTLADIGSILEKIITYHLDDTGSKLL